MQAVTGLDRLRDCGVVPYGAAVTLRLSDGAAGVAGVETCGSCWACSVCSHKIAMKRQDELTAAVNGWTAKGGQIVMATFTMRHNKGHRLETLWRAISDAWNGVTSGRQWTTEKAFYGLAGYIRTAEVTHTSAGWHVHLHVLLFVDPSKGALQAFHGLDALNPPRDEAGNVFRDVRSDGRVRVRQSRDLLTWRQTMFARWVSRLEKRGFSALEGVQDVRMMEDAGAEVADYVTKHVDNGTAVALEVVHGASKRGRQSGSRTPFGILDDLIRYQDAEDARLWWEFEEASRGKRQMTYSKGLRDLLGMNDEQTDEEIAGEEIGSAEDDAVVIPAADYMRLARSGGAVADVLDALETQGPDAAIRLLSLWGIRAERAELRAG